MDPEAEDGRCTLWTVLYSDVCFDSRVGRGRGLHMPCSVLISSYSLLLATKRRLLSLKKELKCWESMFERKHGHKPAKVGFNLGDCYDTVWG